MYSNRYLLGIFRFKDRVVSAELMFKGNKFCKIKVMLFIFRDMVSLLCCKVSRE